jgi:hypothetical protein
VFEPALVNDTEILEKKQEFEFYTSTGGKRRISLDKGQMGFTFCLVPMILTASKKDKITVFYADGSTEEITGRVLNHPISSMIFSRNNEIDRVEISMEMKR